MFNEIQLNEKIYPSLYGLKSANINLSTNLFIYIIGCGGTGGYLIPQIARLLSVKTGDSISPHLILVDADDIEEKNLTRQNFIRKDLGLKKADVLARRYSNAFGIDIHAITEYFPCTSSTNVLSEWFEGIESMIVQPSDNPPLKKRIIIGCVDNINTRKSIYHHVSHEYAIGYATTAWIDAGNSNYAGQVILSMNLNQHGWKDSNLATFFDIFPSLVNEKTKDHPDELSCADHALSAPQNIAANITASNLIFNYFNILYHNTLLLCENTITETPRMKGELVEEMWPITNNVTYFNVSSNTFSNELVVYDYYRGTVSSNDTTANNVSQATISSTLESKNNEFEKALMLYRKHFKPDSEVMVSINAEETPESTEEINDEIVAEEDNTSTPAFNDIFMV